MAKSTTNSKTKKLVFLAVMTALIIFMTLTGLAYIPINPAFKITLLTIPVAIGGIVCGVKSGFFLGTVFGLTSLATCIFAMDPLGEVLFSINPFKTVLFCVLPRIICGGVPAIIYKVIKNKNIGIPTACVLTAVLNTVGFLTTLWLCFGNDLMTNELVINVLGGAVSSIIALFIAFAGFNAIIEAVASLIIGTAACKVVLKLWK